MRVRMRRMDWATPGFRARKMVSARKGLVQVSWSGGEGILLTIWGRYSEHRQETEKVMT
jgi:hypothetical protein